MKQIDIEKHNNCQCDIRYRKFSGRQDLVPGLFCKDHDKFLDWLPEKHAQELIASGVPVNEYTPRKKNKKPKQKASRRNKWKAHWVDRKALGI